MAEAATPSNPEQVAHDDLCPICQLLLFTPVKTQCNHLLCASCMAQWSDASNTHSIEPTSWDVNLEDFDPNYDPTYDLECDCPMCRTRTAATPDNALARQLEHKYPITYAERRVEEEEERGSRIGRDGFEGVMMLIGNKHRLIRNAGDDNEHDWTFFVRTSRPDLIKEVHIYLHPTFRRSHVIIRKPPYEYEARGWGTFVIRTEIVLKQPYNWIMDNAGTRQQALELEWPLNFEREGRQGRVRAKVNRLDAAANSTGRVLRSRHPLPSAPVPDDDDDELDDDYEATQDEDEDDDESSSDEDFEEAASEYVEPSRR
ncbi:uncharacterized protein J4E92_006003 [Alternaria infectoria]|uniref:uncharacterized protein n=1 Tax=Alternaria hordeiaustralica TaxID=1187925 RepID=UPI0020C49874|nr:uncharacterized protein J4E84_002664 [Alternaria hordeiaustralica]XP_051352025.1 uncharacterized protein J4E92_006003 [Alternaria infectoria]KAI4694084.1 hypothetical protein J4E84_002664 [Alternaria hordeiaustralica]KAI4926843.1 hypothetical protein J4E92_006003 [Alternaria infectoria]